MINSSRYLLQAQINQQNLLQTQIATLQTDISTGVRIQNPSDDPIAAARVATIARTQADQTAYSTNVTTAQSIASTSGTTLGSIQTAITQAQTLVLQGQTATLNDSDRATIATQLRTIVSDLQSYAATVDSSGNPIFASGSAVAIPIGQNLSVAPSLSYDDVFGSFDNGSGGTTTLADLVSSAADALDNSDATARSSAVSSILTGMTAAVTHVADAQAAQGTASARINAQGTWLTSQATSLATERQGLESTDVTSAIATLNNKMLTLQAAQAVLAQVNKSTLFDVIS